MRQTPTKTGGHKRSDAPIDAAARALGAAKTAIPAAAAAALTAAFERLGAPASQPQSGLAEAGAAFAPQEPNAAARFEDSVRLQRLFAIIDNEDGRQALLYMAEALAAGEHD